MTDLTGTPAASDGDDAATQTSGAPWPASPNDQDVVELIELFFFAYRDFTGEADAALAEFGFGRAHHRVVHFVNRHPDLRVADLLDILKITKQSLARVLKDLIKDGFVTSTPGPDDRRERLLRLTEKGRALAKRLIDLQTARFRQALSADGWPAQAATQARLFLTALRTQHDGLAQQVERPYG